MEEKKLYTISAYTENSPGVLQRVSTSFTKRKINIESLTVSETSEEGLSLFTITAYVKSKIVPTVVKQIQRIIEVRRVFVSEDTDLVFKEVALIRVNIADKQDLKKIEEVAKNHNADIIHVDNGSAVIHSYGSEEDTRLVYKLLEPYGVFQFARSGRIALRKEFQSIHE